MYYLSQLVSKTLGTEVWNQMQEAQLKKNGKKKGKKMDKNNSKAGINRRSTRKRWAQGMLGTCNKLNFKLKEGLVNQDQVKLIKAAR